MPSEFVRRAVLELIKKAEDAGLDVPDRILQIAMGGGPENNGAFLWSQANPNAEGPWGCCYGNDVKGPEYCTCWTPVFDTPEPQQPRPPRSPADLQARKEMCGDCAFRKNSPEREDEWSEDYLLGLAGNPRTPFFCHDDMRRPTHWVHPDGRTVPGTTSDYQPLFLAGMPYRNSGEPGLLCAGWAHRSARLLAHVEPGDAP